MGGERNGGGGGVKQRLKGRRGLREIKKMRETEGGGRSASLRKRCRMRVLQMSSLQSNKAGEVNEHCAASVI